MFCYSQLRNRYNIFVRHFLAALVFQELTVKGTAVEQGTSTHA
jgi:hypothetical protein